VILCITFEVEFPLEEVYLVFELGALFGRPNLGRVGYTEKTKERTVE
jgi:hypothetical protein